MRKNKLVLGLLALCLCACSTGNKNQANALDEDSYQLFYLMNPVIQEVNM